MRVLALRLRHEEDDCVCPICNPILMTSTLGSVTRINITTTQMLDSGPLLHLGQSRLPSVAR